jgi:nicotinate-nucleotide adenylyltransferase
MQQLEKPLGILGGTFDPIHFGHLRMALEIYMALDLSSVHLMPCFEPVHRIAPIASPQQRFAMVKAAVEGVEGLYADDLEIKRGGRTFTIDTLQAIRLQLPRTPLCLILGIDAFLGFQTWKNWQDILTLAHIIVTHRPFYHLPETGAIAELTKAYQQEASTYVHEHLAGSILLRPITALEISATEIRKQIALSKSPRFLLPKIVYDYIKQNAIYQAIN